MTLDDYLLEGFDYAFLEEPYVCFWVTGIIEAMALLGPTTDVSLERLCDCLLDHCASQSLFSQVGRQLYQEILHIRRVASWQDTSSLGLKYRCLAAIAGWVAMERFNSGHLQYCILTAYQSINYDGDKDAILIERISSGLAAQIR